MVVEEQGDDLVVDLLLLECVAYGADALAELSVGVGLAVDEQGLTVGMGGDAVEEGG